MFSNVSWNDWSAKKGEESEVEGNVHFGGGDCDANRSNYITRIIKDFGGTDQKQQLIHMVSFSSERMTDTTYRDEGQ